MTTTKKKITEDEVKVKRAPRTVMISSPVSPNIRFAVASEMADDSLIESEMMGEVLSHFIYQFPQEGKTVSGLSVKGVSEVVRRLNRNPKSGYKIHIKPEFLKIERDVEYNGEKGVEVSVFAEDLITGNSAWGLKFEAYSKAKRGGGSYANTFAVEKALSKAERNAKRKLIPETLAVKMIQKLINEDKNNVIKIEAPAYTQSNVKISAPKASTAEQLFEVIMVAIGRAKKIDDIIDIDEKAQLSDKLTSEMKKKIHTQAVSDSGKFS
jgi:hypothetical protein